MFAHTCTADALQLPPELSAPAQSDVTNNTCSTPCCTLRGKKCGLMMINGCVRLVTLLQVLWMFPGSAQWQTSLVPSPHSCCILCRHLTHRARVTALNKQDKQRQCSKRKSQVSSVVATYVPSSPGTAFESLASSLPPQPWMATGVSGCVGNP